MSAAVLLQTAIDALSLGATYALLALGMAIVFSVMGLVNFAHGELITLSAYAMFVLAAWVHAPGPVVAIGTIATATGAAVLMERIAFRPVRGASEATLLVTSFALSITIQNALVVTVGARGKPVAVPDWVNSALNVGGYTISLIQVATLISTVLCLVVLRLFLTRTIAGVGMRAAAQDFVATRLMGIRANSMISLAFAISGMLAGVAAILIVARRGTVDPYMGLSPVLAAFTATVLGGLGNLTGAVVGGFTLGIVQVAFQATLPSGLTVFSQAFAFSVVIAILLVRPQGLMGRRAIR
jgi:branched-chain amino acid transport system permease protein